MLGKKVSSRVHPKKVRGGKAEQEYESQAYPEGLERDNVGVGSQSVPNSVESPEPGRAQRCGRQRQRGHAGRAMRRFKGKSRGQYDQKRYGGRRLARNPDGAGGTCRRLAGR